MALLAFPEKMDRRYTLMYMRWGEEVSILADTPFAKEEDVRYRLADHHLHLDVNTSGKRIGKSIKVPGACGDVATTFKNGVLEIQLRKECRFTVSSASLTVF